MKSLDFKYIYAQNFLCFGPDGIEFNFNNYSNIVLIKGNNADIKEIDDKVASNGVGKSSIPEIIVYTLFGKTIKHPKKITHKDVINNQISKNLKTEVRWGDFRVVRTRKPDSLRIWEDKNYLWQDESEITLGGIPATQKLIEEKIGLNYETFVNVLVFTDNNSGSFLECDAADKRQIVENLLSLDKYRDFAEKAKDLKKEKKDSIKSTLYEFETLSSQTKQLEDRLQSAKNQEAEWKIQKNNEIKDLKQKIELLKKDILENDQSKNLSIYLEAQDKIEAFNSEIKQIEDSQKSIEDTISLAKDKFSNVNRLKNAAEILLDNLDNDINKSLEKIKECKKEISRFKEGSKCKFCLGTISEGNYGKYVEEVNNKIKELEKEQVDQESNKKKTQEEIDSTEKVLNKIKKGISTYTANFNNNSKTLSQKKKEILDLQKINKPQNKETSDQIVTEKIYNLNDQVSNKNDELINKNPFVMMIGSITSDLEKNKLSVVQKKEELDSLEKDLPYYDFWVTAFGDSGIRKFVIDGIIPALNSRIAYWMQLLIDGKIKLEFNNELEETIERSPSDGDSFVYHAMSGGERRRLNLAVSQAFAYVMGLNSGVCPSVVFLDEVTTNIDPIGVIGVYNMIMELSRDRKVFITTHDQNLLDLLDGCDVIRLEKKAGLTKIKKV
jgi:DNA repair exonuclease SbcCD ATPase subunit